VRRPAASPVGLNDGGTDVDVRHQGPEEAPGPAWIVGDEGRYPDLAHEQIGHLVLVDS
jgi:hypothetical protein